MDIEEKIRQEWEKQCKTMMQLFVVCNICGGSSTSSCYCAYQRFRNKMLYGAIQFPKKVTFSAPLFPKNDPMDESP